jgi:hypothetical protein
MTNGGDADEIMNNLPGVPNEIKNNLRQGPVIIPISSGFGPIRMFNSKFNLINVY